MNKYSNDRLAGELWLRDLNNVINPAYNTLSSVFFKYQNYTNFYNNLTSNNITKFDTFYDSILIQTPNGYAFEKLKVENSTIQPYNEFALYCPNNATLIDYWFDEYRKKVYFCGFNDLTPVYSPQLNLSLYFNEYDLNTGNVKDLLNSTITLKLCAAQNWTSTNGSKEAPVLTYNIDTDIFNISFIVKNSIGTIGLISINLNGSDYIKITEVNCFLPYATVDLANSTIN